MWQNKVTMTKQKQTQRYHMKESNTWLNRGNQVGLTKQSNCDKTEAKTKRSYKESNKRLSKGVCYKVTMTKQSKYDKTKLVWQNKFKDKKPYKG